MIAGLFMHGGNRLCAVIVSRYFINNDNVQAQMK